MIFRRNITVLCALKVFDESFIMLHYVLEKKIVWAVHKRHQWYQRIKFGKTSSKNDVQRDKWLGLIDGKKIIDYRHEITDD